MRNNLDSILISSLFSFSLFSSPPQWTSSHRLLFISVRVLVLLLITLFFPAVSQFYDIKTIIQPGNRANNHKATINEHSKAANATSDQLIGPRGTFQNKIFDSVIPQFDPILKQPWRQPFVCGLPLWRLEAGIPAVFLFIFWSQKWPYLDGRVEPGRKSWLDWWTYWSQSTNH